MYHTNQELIGDRGKPEVVVPLKETLMKYCESHPLPANEKELPAECVAETKMEKFVETVLSFIRKPDFRKRTIFLYGRKRTGKTRVLCGLEEIFSMVKIWH